MALPLRNATVKTLKEMIPLVERSRSIATTPQKMKAYSPTIGGEETQTNIGIHRRKSIKEELLPKGKPISDYVPVYVALGMIGLSVSLGLYTAKQELLHGPDVRVKKSRRETLPEVVEPEYVAHESEKFLNKSFFRKVGQIQEMKTAVDNPGNTPAREPRVESLKTVGVDRVELPSSYR